MIRFVDRSELSRQDTQELYSLDQTIGRLFLEVQLHLVAPLRRDL